MSNPVAQSDISSRDQLLDDLNKAEAACHEAIRILQDIIRKLEKHQKKMRISTTAAIVGGIVGTGLMLTPAFYIGVALTSGSAVSLIGTEIDDAVVNNSEKKKIATAVEAVKECSVEVDKHHENVCNFAQELQSIERLSKDDAYDTAWYWYACKGAKGAIKAKKFVFDAKNAFRCMRASRAFKGGLALKNLSAGLAGLSTKSILRSIRIAGKKVVGGVVLIAFDLWTLVQTWRNENLTLVQAKEALSKLEELKEAYSQEITNLTSTAWLR